MSRPSPIHQVPALAETRPAPSSPRRGWPGLRCPECGEADCLVVSLADTAALHCDQCSNELVAAAASRQAAMWQDVLAWLNAAPAAE